MARREGGILLIGGQCRHALEGYRLDARDGHFFLEAPDFDLPPGVRASSLFDDEQQVLITGGRSRGWVVRAEALLFSPLSRRWSAVASLPGPRAFHTSTTLRSGDVLITGGELGDGVYLNTCAVFSARTRRWRSVAPMPENRAFHVAVLLPSGRVLVAGGYNNYYLRSAAVYSPDEDVWRSAQPLRTARSSAAACLLPDGAAMVVGGHSGESALASVELYDEQTNAWRPAPDMPSPVYKHSATLVQQAFVVVAGGRLTIDRPIATVQIYAWHTHAWLDDVAPLTQPRDCHTAVQYPNHPSLLCLLALLIF